MFFDFDELSVFDRYKLIVSTIVPRPIAWVVTNSSNGCLNAAPFSFFNIVCEDPPILCLGVGGAPTGGRKDTARNIMSTGEFVVNLVSHEIAPAMNVTAIDFPAEVNELEAAGLTPAPCRKVSLPRIADSPVSFECRLAQAISLGQDATVILGEIVAAHIDDAKMLDPAKRYVDTPGLDIVGRMHGAGWYARTTDRFEIDRIEYDEWLLREADEQ